MIKAASFGYFISSMKHFKNHDRIRDNYSYKTTAVEFAADDDESFLLIRVSN